MTSAPPLEAPAYVPRRKSSFLLDTLTLSVIAALAKLAGAAKSVAIAGVFGSSRALDDYLLAFLIPSVLADAFCGALVPVTVPRLIELEHRSGESAAQALYFRLLNRSLRFALMGVLAMAIGIGGLLVLAGHMVPSNWRSIELLTLIMLPVIPCNAVSNVWRAVLNSQDKFAAPAITAVLTPAVIIFGVLGAGSWGGMWTLAAATTLGAVAEVVVLALALQRQGLAILPGVPKLRSSVSRWTGFGGSTATWYRAVC